MNKKLYIYLCLSFLKQYSSSSYRPVSMSQRCAHIRAVVFHTLNRGLPITRIFPYLVMFTMLDRLYSIPSTLPHVTRRPPLPPSKSRLHIPSFPLANRPELLLIYHDTNQRGGLKRGGVAPLAIFIAASTNHTLILYGNNDINRGGRVGMGGG